MSSLRTQRSASGEARTCNPSISSQALSELHEVPKSHMLVQILLVFLEFILLHLEIFLDFIPLFLCHVFLLLQFLTICIDLSLDLIHLLFRYSPITYTSNKQYCKSTNLVVKFGRVWGGEGLLMGRGGVGSQHRTYAGIL